MKSRRSLRLICTLFVLIFALGALTPSFAYPSHTDYLSDGAEVLDDGTERSFKEISAALKTDRHVNLALCTVQSTGGESIDAYASALFSSWEVGHGLLILIVTENGSYYAVPSRSLEEYLPNDKLADIVNTTMETYVAQSDYSGAVSSVSRALSDYINENVPKDFGVQKTYMPTALKVILIIVVIVALLLIAGYIVLVYLERKNAQRQRMMLEMRRRRAGEMPRRAPANRPYNQNSSQMPRRNAPRPYPDSRVAPRDDMRRGAPRPNGANTGVYTGARGGASGAMTDNARYGVDARRAPQSAQDPGSARNYPARQNAPYRNMQSVAYPNDLSQNQATGAVNFPRSTDRTVSDNYDKAATVQISTADIRAVRGGRSKFYDGTQ